MVELHSMETEQTVLGAILQKNGLFYESGLVESDFHFAEHGRVFTAIAGLLENNLTADVMAVMGEVQDEVELKYLSDLYLNTTTANFVIYAEKVKDLSVKRLLREKLHDGLAMLESKKAAVDILADVQTNLEGVNVTSGSQDSTFQEVLREGLESIEEAQKRLSEGGVVGAPTGLPAIDRRTGGLYGPRLWCVAGRPGLGKSALAQQFAIHSAGKGYPVGIISLEMGAEEIATRAFSHKLQVNLTALSHGDERTVDIATERLPKSNIKSLPIWVDTKSQTLGAIVSRITEWKRKHNVAYVIVDYIGLIELDAYSNRNDDLGKVSRTFKKLCMKLDMPIIILSQLNRMTEKEKRRPKLSDLRDSGNIEQDIDVGVFIYSGDTDTETVDVELGLLKNRKGRKGWLPERFNFDGRIQTFKEVMYAVA